MPPRPQEWRSLLAEARAQCAALPPAMALADRACALDAESKARWRRALAAHAEAAAPSTGASGAVFIDLLTHLLLDQDPLVPADAHDLLTTYRALGVDGAIVRAALEGLS